MLYLRKIVGTIRQKREGRKRERFDTESKGEGVCVQWVFRLIYRGGGGIPKTRYSEVMSTS